MQYGFYETIRNGISLVITKLCFHNARLIRYPFFLRNRKYVKISDGFTTGYNCRIEAIERDGVHGEIIFGKNVKMGDYVHIASAEKVVIGDNVLMASHILITDLDHGSYDGEMQSRPDSLVDLRELNTKPVQIGNNVWIGENVTILKGVHIGDNCVLGTNALVLKDVDANSIVVGSPAKVIKKYNFETEKWEKV